MRARPTPGTCDGSILVPALSSLRPGTTSQRDDIDNESKGSWARWRDGSLALWRACWTLQPRGGEAVTVAVIQDFDGATLEQYDRAIAKMGLVPGGKHSHPGCLFHWVAKTDDGFRVVDVWTSREEFEAFLADQVVPDSLEAEFPSPPRNTFYDVHTYFQ
jgi:hypothetical protein